MTLLRFRPKLEYQNSSPKDFQQHVKDQYKQDEDVGTESQNHTTDYLRRVEGIRKDAGTDVKSKTLEKNQTER